ncbi:hypothetical protein U27_06351 [Candidatus Vecturithrix granuli]|uniref:ABC transporter substrate-binding protein n=1 Tax=Vecturithrix granuli TaxID=1499967 RepID=A0A081C462_VECG1|nr:hypothetical protein U27_06351 [Candidatus Vecturithrix granuli]
MKHPKTLNETCAWLCVVCGLLLFSPQLFAAETFKILVLNSDAAVTKYQLSQEEFQKIVPFPVKAIDLGNKKWDAPAVEELLYDEDPDLVYCLGIKAYLIANKYVKNAPIVFSSIINWLRLPMTEKTYGVSNELPVGMEIMLFHYVFPEVQRIGVLYSKKYTQEWFKQASKEAKEMGIELVGSKVTDKKHVNSHLKKLLPEVDAYWLISDPTLMTEKQELFDILDLCHRTNKPVFSYHETFASFGAVLTVSVDDPTIGRQAAGIAMEVLAETTFDEKVQFPAGSYIVLNLKRVKEYGLSYNEDALGSINDILE